MGKIIEQIEEMETLDQLKVVVSTLNIIIEATRYNLETEQEQKDFKELEKMSNKIFDIILKNEK